MQHALAEVAGDYNIKCPLLEFADAYSQAPNSQVGVMKSLSFPIGLIGVKTLYNGMKQSITYSLIGLSLLLRTPIQWVDVAQLDGCDAGLRGRVHFRCTT